MSVVLRHKRLPFIMVYSDPKKSWDDVVKKKLLKEIEKSAFNSFVEELSVPPLFRQMFNPVPENDVKEDENEG